MKKHHYIKYFTGYFPFSIEFLWKLKILEGFYKFNHFSIPDLGEGMKLLKISGMKLI